MQTSEESIKAMNETLDRMEIKVNEISKMLSEIMAEIEKHREPKVFQTDGEIMFYDRWRSLTDRIKNKKNEQTK